MKDYKHLRREYASDGVLLITIDRPQFENRANARLHWELGQIWLDVASDDNARVAVITGAGEAFCAGGEIAKFMSQVNDFGKIEQLFREAKDIVQNMVDCEKPIVSAINGRTAGVGAVVGLTADISVAAETASISDGHTKMGITAGDHGALVWPLACGFAKASYYLLTCESLSGAEAERIGLVSRSVPRIEVLPEALRIAQGLSLGPQQAIRWTKRALRHWHRTNMPTFEASLAMEMLNFFQGDVMEAARAQQEGRTPQFPSVRWVAEHG